MMYMYNFKILINGGGATFRGTRDYMGQFQVEFHKLYALAHKLYVLARFFQRAETPRWD